MVKGIFIVTKQKDEALRIFDSLADRYRVRHASNGKQDVSLCKYYCYSLTKAIENCFATELWGAKRCLRIIDTWSHNDNAGEAERISMMLSSMHMQLRNTIANSIPMKDWPSCKELSELSVADAITAAKDLVENKITKSTISVLTLGKKIGDTIKIGDIWNFYKEEIAELEREIKDENRPMNELEEFLMIKFQAELGYCQKALVKVGLDMFKEINGLVNDYEDAIRKYESQLPETNNMILNSNK